MSISSSVARAAFVMAPLAVLLAACPSGPIKEAGSCDVDADCPAYNACVGGVCRCNTDDACDATEFCNLAGSCQERLECLTVEDCRADGNIAAICDTRAPMSSTELGPDDNVRSKSSGQCVELNSTTTQCLMDSHCPFGFFCDNGRCAPGCRDNGDCPLGDPCINNQCDSAPGACNENGYCEFGQTCGPDNRCRTHPDADILCQRCAGDDFFDSTCGDGACLIDPGVPGGLCASDNDCSEGYCVKFPCSTNNDCPPGETCEAGAFFGGTCSGHCGDFFCGNASCDDASNPCPRGYTCFKLIGVSNNLCTRGGNQCAAGATCSADLAGENNENGSCSCLSNGDCPIGLTCSDPGPAGACIQGSTCAPSDGLTCDALR